MPQMAPMMWLPLLLVLMIILLAIKSYLYFTTQYNFMVEEKENSLNNKMIWLW